MIIMNLCINKILLDLLILSLGLHQLLLQVGLLLLVLRHDISLILFSALVLCDGRVQSPHVLVRDVPFVLELKEFLVLEEELFCEK